MCVCVCVHSLSCVRLFATPWTVACQAPLFMGFSRQEYWSGLPFPSPGNLPDPGQADSLHRATWEALINSYATEKGESALCIRWPNYWGFSINISPSNEYSGLVSFRIGWLHLLAVQGTLKSLIQHHISKASILWPSAFLWSNSHIHTRLLEKP